MKKGAGRFSVRAVRPAAWAWPPWRIRCSAQASSTLLMSTRGVLRADPYQLIRYVKGYGFKKVDKIARAMGTPKDHPGRLAAGLLFIVSDELTSGHTWISRAKLIEKANDLLLLDAMDSLWIPVRRKWRLNERH